MTNLRDLDLRRTPRLAALLDRLGARLTRGIWLHGLGSVLVVAVLWIGFAFFADWALHVPRAVRWLHLGVLVGLPGYVVWRELLRPLARRPDPAGLAVLLERAHPELHELIVSAVQLQASPDGSPALVDRVLARAEEAAGDLELTGVLDARGPRRRFAAGGAVALAGAALCVLSPSTAAIFANRLLGGTASWPQRTHLTVSVPLLQERAQIDETPERIHVRVARGTDVPVLVRAAGVVPDDVTVHFDGGQELLLSPGAEGAFRTILRSCQESLAFHVTGGDDRDGLPRVEVEVLQPPDVAGIAVRVEPPAYTGEEPRTEFDLDVSVPAGSRLSIAMLPEPAGAAGRVRVLPDDVLLDLAPRPFPVRPSDGDVSGEVERQGLGFDWVADASFRYRFELRDETGLQNPDPGLFAVHVLEDRAPDVQVLSPARSDFDTTPVGAVSLRVRVEDDHGVASLRWSARLPATAGEAEPPRARGELEFTPVERDGADWRSDAAGVVVAARRRLEVAELLAELGAGPDAFGQLVLEVEARDNRPAPEGPGDAGREPADDPAVGRAAPVRVRIVSADELLRRVQDRLARVRTQAAALEELERRKEQRVGELLTAIESDDLAALESSNELAAALSGERRVQGDAAALTREVAAIVETVLYARLDEKAGALLEQVDGSLALRTQRSFSAEPWLELAAAHAEGRLGSPTFAGQLVGILDACLKLSEEDTQATVAALDRAGLAVDVGEVHAALTEAADAQRRTLARLEDLLDRLAEWDNFQSILSLTRDILNQQKSLAERTRHLAREK